MLIPFSHFIQSLYPFLYYALVLYILVPVEIIAAQGWFTQIVIALKYTMLRILLDYPLCYLCCRNLGFSFHFSMLALRCATE